MKYNINLFGYSIDCVINFASDRMQIEISEEDQRSLYAYLVRVLEKYGYDPSEKQSFESLVQFAIKVERSMNGHLSEPKLKLPYEFQPDIKEMLIKAAELQELSATQLLIRLIEKKYQSVIGEDV